MPMRAKSTAAAMAFILFACAGTAFGDAYQSLLRRYEKQIRRQERELKSLRSRLEEKEKDIGRWQTKAESAKSAWSQASSSLQQARQQVKRLHGKRDQSRLLADAARWKSAENALIAQSASVQTRALAQDLYGRELVFGQASALTIEEAAPEFFSTRLAALSASSDQLAQAARLEETSLRNEELRWQDEELARSHEADSLHQKQEAQWMKWQEALRRKTALQDEIGEIDQSAKALQVMLEELRDHRDQARAAADNRPADDRALAALRGTLPWPAHGKVVQRFGRQDADGVNPLVVSNGIKIEAGAGRPVRVVQDGTVLFAGPFRDYGNLVIIQHKNGLTSVYGGLGETRVQVGQTPAALDPIGTTGESGAFYFELRRDEAPINPLVYLSTTVSSELSSRRTFR